MLPEPRGHDAVTHVTMHRGAPTTKDQPAPSVSSAKGDRPDLEEKAEYPPALK